MITTARVLTEAELIELENWLDEIDGQRVANEKRTRALRKQRPDDWHITDTVHVSCSRVEQILDRVRPLLDLARTVKNRG